jgi:hypothetical protein
MPAVYNGLMFETELEATWAAFFDLAGWKWDVNPLPLDNWAPDFRVTFPCRHSECGGSHSLLIAVLPIDDIRGFGSHPCLGHIYGPGTYADNMQVHIDAGAAFGSGPAVTRWEMSHGAGGGTETVYNWVPANANADILWGQAKSLVAKI